MKKVSAGQVADLKQQFPDDADRVIRANFLEKLLTASLRDIVVDRRGVRIVNGVLIEPLDLENAEIPHHIALENFRFEHKVNFSKSFFRKSASFSGSSFKSRADFTAMKVGDLILFQKVTFAGATSFVSADIGNHFVAGGIQFTDPSQEADFTLMKVGGMAVFPDAIFAGPTTFLGVETRGHFIASGAKFRNSVKGVRFTTMKVGGGAFFQGAVFAGPAEFQFMKANELFTAARAQFASTEHAADFMGMKAGGDSSFRQAMFSGPVRFLGAEFGTLLNFAEAEFKGRNHVADFSQVQGDGVAVFTGALFTGPVLISDARFLDVLIGGIRGSLSLIPQLDLSRTRIRRELRIKDVKVQDLVAVSLQVEGPTALSELEIQGKANLGHSSFLTIALSNVVWPTARDSVRLEGMTYKSISAGSESDSWIKLIDLLNYSVYNASAYADLEAFFQRQGYPDRANQVFVALKERERKEFLSGSTWLWNLFLGYLVNHGRNPEWTLYWSAISILLGWLLFNPRFMEPQKPEYAAWKYTGFWYSADVFLPFIDLQAANIWMPKKNFPFHRHSVRVLRIIGWVLVPMGLMALTGIIK